MYSDILLYKVDLVCAESVKAKPTINYSGLITYPNTIFFSGIWLGNSGYLITQSQYIVKNRLPHGSKFGEEKESPRLVKLVIKTTS